MKKEKLIKVLGLLGDLLDNEVNDIEYVKTQMLSNLKPLPKEEVKEEVKEEKPFKLGDNGIKPTDITDFLEKAEDKIQQRLNDKETLKEGLSDDATARQIELMRKMEKPNPALSRIIDDNMSKESTTTLINDIIYHKVNDLLFNLDAHLANFNRNRLDKISNHNLKVKTKIIMDVINTLSKRGFIKDEEIKKDMDVNIACSKMFSDRMKVITKDYAEDKVVGVGVNGPVVMSKNHTEDAINGLIGVELEGGKVNLVKSLEDENGKSLIKLNIDESVQDMVKFAKQNELELNKGRS